MSGRPSQPSVGVEASPRVPDWEAATREAVAYLQALIRIPTVNPPGAELACAEYVHGVLTHEGIESLVLEPAAGRGIVVARLRAERRERDSRPARGSGEAVPGALLLLAHMDVVGVEREHWTVDPFAGEIRDGFVYGRGAIDDKGMLAANLVAMLLAKRLLLDGGVTLTRDLVLVASADEETGSQWGLEWLLAHHTDRLDAAFALNEGGRIRVVGGAPLYAAVQTAEKVPHIIRMTARGTSGHASVPLPDNPIVRLARALAAIGAHREPLALVPTTRRFFERLSAVWPVETERTAMGDLISSDPARQQRGVALLAGFPALDALTRNGISATIIAGGIRENVIPAEATAVLNLRTLPGESPDSVVTRLADVVNDPLVELAITSRGADAPAADLDSAMFRTIAETLTSLDPRLTVVPYMSTGATDSARLRRAGVPTFGLLPFPLTPEDEGRMHGHDERLSVEAMGFGVKAVYGIVERMVRARQTRGNGRTDE